MNSETRGTLAGRTVLVTGGASGLGAAVVQAVLEAGGNAIVLDLAIANGAARTPVAVGARAGDAGAGDGRAGEAGDVVGYTAVGDLSPGGAFESRTAAFALDVSDGQAVPEVIAAAAEVFGGIDAVVTAAGIDRCGRLDQVAADDWNKVIGVNLLGTAAVIRSAMPWLKESANGRVVTVASTLGLRALPEATAYCASKFGIIGFSRALGAETRGEIGVTTLIPGGMNTAFFDSREEKYRPADPTLLNDPARVADSVIFALRQPKGCEIRELLICPSSEDSWP
jgi:NAD(P)-dependent dehydrogenase (short-subunit alcohol dehydrogenase family)